MQTPHSNLMRITAVLNAWQNMRPGTSFGVSLEEFRRTVQPSLDSRARIATLEAQLVAERATRDAADQVSMQAARRVVDSVMATPGEGPDGAVYAAMGFVRKSEVRRGLVRRLGRKRVATRRRMEV